ncbi:MAG: Lrp/AsnC family transcriptional regulator [Lutispora sp.]|nr:Lrp/AsnC family transcriptional regulator [Lutispora sp.]
MSNYDKLDIEIMKLLQKDGRMSFRELGKELDRPESTIRARYNNLVEKGILRIVAIATPNLIGLNIMAMVFIKVAIENFDDAVKTIREFSEVRFIAYTSGVYDLIVELYVKDTEEIVDFMTNKLSKVPGIKEYDLSFELKLFKDSYEWVRDDI